MPTSVCQMLKVEGLEAAYGAAKVLHGVSIDVGAGELVTVIGSNGAGKTTLLRVVSGLLAPVRGSVALRGESIGGKRAHRVAKLGVALIPEDRDLFHGMTVHESLLLGLSSRKQGDRAGGCGSCTNSSRPWSSGRVGRPRP